MWGKLGWLIWFWQFLCDGLSFFNPKRVTIVCRGFLSPPFQIIPPSLIPSLPFKKVFNLPPFPIIFFQTLNVVMLISSAKSWSARGVSHQPAIMVCCLTISHTCFSCLPRARVSHCVPSFTEVRSGCYSRKWVWSSRTKSCCMASRK